MPTQTQQKLYFATILDLKHQRTPLRIRWVAYFWKRTIRVVSRTDLWMPVASQRFYLPNHYIISPLETCVAHWPIYGCVLCAILQFLYIMKACGLSTMWPMCGKLRYSCSTVDCCKHRHCWAVHMQTYIPKNELSWWNTAMLAAAVCCSISLTRRIVRTGHSRLEPWILWE